MKLVSGRLLAAAIAGIGILPVTIAGGDYDDVGQYQLEGTRRREASGPAYLMTITRAGPEEWSGTAPNLDDVNPRSLGWSGTTRASDAVISIVRVGVNEYRITSIQKCGDNNFAAPDRGTARALIGTGTLIQDGPDHYSIDFHLSRRVQPVPSGVLASQRGCLLRRRSRTAPRSRTRRRFRTRHRLVLASRPRERRSRVADSRAPSAGRGPGRHALAQRVPRAPGTRGDHSDGTAAAGREQRAAAARALAVAGLVVQALAAATVWISRAHGGFLPARPALRRLADDLSGRSMKPARARLAELAAFAREDATGARRRG